MTLEAWDVLEKARPGGSKYGAAQQGIAPFCSAKYQKKAMPAGTLFCFEEQVTAE